MGHLYTRHLYAFASQLPRFTIGTVKYNAKLSEESGDFDCVKCEGGCQLCPLRSGGLADSSVALGTVSVQYRYSPARES